MFVTVWSMKVYSAVVALINWLKTQSSYSEWQWKLPGSHSKYSKFKFDQFFYMNLGLAF